MTNSGKVIDIRFIPNYPKLLQLHKRENEIKDLSMIISKKKPCLRCFFSSIYFSKEASEKEQQEVEMFDENVEEAYLAGLKASKETKWHDLRKNPNDLPQVHSTVLDENGDKITYRGGGVWTVYSDFYEKGIDADPPIAWCEIPKFEE